MLPYAEVDRELGKLLMEFGPRRQSYHPEYPCLALAKKGADPHRKLNGSNQPHIKIKLNRDPFLTSACCLMPRAYRSYRVSWPIHPTTPAAQLLSKREFDRLAR
jgi:hypothetical protein